MFCSNCGAQNPEGAVACAGCRQPIAQGTNAPAPGRPGGRFKGTMLMAGTDGPGGIPGLPTDPFAPPASIPDGNYPKTIAGGMDVFDPNASGEDPMESRTVLQPNDNFGPGRPPPPPAIPQPPAPAAATQDLGAAHTMALESTAFGGGAGVPPPSPPFGSASWGQQAPPPPASPYPGLPPGMGPPGGPMTGASTVALDASAFGLDFGASGPAGAPAASTPSPFGPPGRAITGSPQPSPFGPPGSAQNTFAPPQGGAPGPAGGGFNGDAGSKGVASTVAIDASQFNFGSAPYGAPQAAPGAAPGPMGMPLQGPPPGAAPNPWGQPQGQPQNAWGQPQGQPQYGNPYPQQPGMSPYGALRAPAAPGGTSKGLWIVVGIVLFLLAVGASAAVMVFAHH